MESLAKSVFVLILISFITAPACSQSLHASQNPVPVGSSVTLVSTSSVSTGAWLFNNDMIVMIFQGGEIISNQWNKRVTYNSSANHTSLTISSLQVEDSGNYTLQAMNFFRVQLELLVQAPIGSVMVKDGGKAAILHKPFKLDCQVMGEVNSIHWFRNDQLISTDNTTNLTFGNRTLVLSPVQHSDKADYYCQAFNYVSNVTSSSYTLQVNYGPMTPKVTKPTMALTGDQKTLDCTSASHPPSLITWHFNNSIVANGSLLAIGPLTLNMSGTYICKAFNNVTNETSMSATMVVVYAPVTRTSVRIVGGHPILNHTLTLACETTGSVKSLIWMYNWSPLVEDSAKFLSMDNTTLTFSPIVQTDNGNYQCVASNPLSNYTGGFKLEYFYGPEMAMIIGANDAQTGDIVILRCNALSNPLSNYTWFFNGSSVAIGSDLVTAPLTVDMSGMYTCIAHNNITGKESLAYTVLTVHDEITFVQVMAPEKPAIEGHLYHLMCNVTGAAEKIYWMKNGELVHEDKKAFLHVENRTLIFYLLDRNDRGHYQCIASNPVWNMTSPEFQLDVNYGPEEPIISGTTFVECGKIAHFECFALSHPYSLYTWWFNGTQIASAQWIHIGPISFNQSGKYTCMAYNHVTMKSSTNSTMLTVVEAIESVMIRNDSVPINHKNLTLTCEVTGSSDMIYWMKDDMLLNMSASVEEESMSFDIENNTLQFHPVTISDDGVYHCVANNQAAQHLSLPYNLLVNYGPLSVKISDPTPTGLGFTVTLYCSADSRPGGVFRWFFDNRTLFLEDGPVLTMSEEAAKDGNYICEVSNPVTNITMYTMKDVTFGHANPITSPSRGSLLALFALSFMLHS